MTTLSKTQISQLTTDVTKKGHGGLATSQKCIDRFLREATPIIGKEAAEQVLACPTMAEAQAMVKRLTEPDSAPAPAPKPRKAKAPATDKGPSKQDQVIALLRTPEGASIKEIAERFGWQQHTVRGMVAGALKKKLGLQPVASKDEARGTVYRLPAEAEAAQ